MGLLNYREPLSIFSDFWEIFFENMNENWIISYSFCSRKENWRVEIMFLNREISSLKLNITLPMTIQFPRISQILHQLNRLGRNLDLYLQCSCLWTCHSQSRDHPSLQGLANDIWAVVFPLPGHSHGEVTQILDKEVKKVGDKIFLWVVWVGGGRSVITTVS